MHRRHFITTTAAAGIAGWTLPCELRAVPAGGVPFDELLRGLLRDWCDALIRLQVNEPADPARHGAFRCPVCAAFHGRCGDAVLPLLEMAAQTGERRYLEAALSVAGWMKNVDAADGAWTNDLDPKSWKGTTVFTATMFAEALEWHGGLLDEATRTAWRERLRRAGEFIFLNLAVDDAKRQATFGGKPTNANYGVSGAYALDLLGKTLGDDRFRQRGRELARQALALFTPRDHFLFGEGHGAQPLSPRGCYPVDLGYNVEESLPNLVHHALHTGDQPALDMAVAAFKTHLEFMLPDGAWDNSWGTRSFKWSYWGSRTSDGCQAALVRLADRDPVFATAAVRNAELLRACTHEGLLHGGPHYASHGVKACVHHTFTHAKQIAAALHYRAGKPEFPPLPPLPRELAQGLRHYPEVGVHLAGNGPWRATFSEYDWSYAKGVFQATGGAPGMLWHEALGPVLSASLARYVPVEAHNMQAVPDGEDFPLTVRIEHRSSSGVWFTNLFDLTATLRAEVAAGEVRVVAATRLVAVDGSGPTSSPCRFEISYTLTRAAFVISARPLDPLELAWSLVLPVIARSAEAATQTAPNRWEISKPAGKLVVSSDAPIARIATRRERVFNLVPGFEAVPLEIAAKGAGPVTCEFRVGASSQ